MMIHHLLVILAAIGAFTVGSLLAPVAPPSAMPPVPSTDTIRHWPLISEGPRHHYGWGHFWRPFWEYYCGRTPVGQVILGLHDPELRATAATYIQQAWTEIKASTSTISPTAADRLEQDLEPFAEQTLTAVENRLNQ